MSTDPFATTSSRTSCTDRTSETFGTPTSKTEIIVSSNPISESTECDLRKLCETPCKPICSTQYYDPGISNFDSIITPVANLQSRYSKIRGSVEFRMRRRNKTVTLQWEPFQGAIGISGISHLIVTQIIANTPPYPVSFPISIRYKNRHRLTFMEINPHERNGNIKFYLNEDKSATDIQVNDGFYFPASCVTWIVD